jgi:hypothetical protein
MALLSDESHRTFRRNVSLPYSVSKNNPSTPTCFTLVSSLDYSLNLQMAATCSSETSVDFQRTTRRYIPEDKQRFENDVKNIPILKGHVAMVYTVCGMEVKLQAFFVPILKKCEWSSSRYFRFTPCIHIYIKVK